MAQVPVSVYLDTEQHADIINWLETIPKSSRSREIRKAIRQYMGNTGITLTDIYQAIQELKRTGLTVQQNGSAPNDEPADIAANIDKLGL